LGDELEKFQNNCNSFQKISHLPIKIKKKCKIYNSQIKKAFNIGYSLDSYIDSDKINKKKLNKYLSLLRKLDESKKDILESIYTEVAKARKNKDIKYYSQLISNSDVRLYSIDYKFMKENIKYFSNNTRYINHMQYLKSLNKPIKPIDVPIDYSRIDKKAYEAYLETKIYKINSNRKTTSPYTALEATNNVNNHTVDWTISLKSFSTQTGIWANLGAIAKAYHSNYLYITLRKIL